MTTDWIPFSRPNWLGQDIRAAQREWRDYPTPGTGPYVLDQLRERLSSFWEVDERHILLTDSCTSAIGLWGAVRGAYSVAVPGMTWPGSFCAIPGEDKHPMDLVDCDTPMHRTDHNSLNVQMRLYGEEHQDAVTSGARPDHLVDAAHDVSFYPGNILRESKHSAVAYSFGPCKELSAERGGALVSRLCAEDAIQIMANSAVTKHRRCSGQFGVKGSMTPSNAAAILSQLDRFEEDRGRRWGILEWYRANAPKQIDICGQSGHLAVLLFPNWRSKESFQTTLTGYRVRTGHHYNPVQPHSLPNAASFSARCVTVPCFARWKGKSELGRMQEAMLAAWEGVLPLLDQEESQPDM